MTSIDGSIIDKAWETYVNDIVEAIDQGFLDDSIRKIARACFDRRDALKQFEKTPQRIVLPKNPVPEEALDVGKHPIPAFADEEATYGPTGEFTYEEATLAKLREVAREKGIDGTNVSKADLIKRLRRYDQSEAEAEAYSEPSRARGTNAKTGSVPKVRSARRRSFGGDDTFRFTDGRLYKKSDVRGQTFRYQEARGGKFYYGKVSGAGPKSFKVTWVHDLKGTPCDLSDDSHRHCAPMKYRDPKAKDGRKVTFMGLSHFDEMVKKLTPIKED
jgi:hypothetical protein